MTTAETVEEVVSESPPGFGIGVRLALAVAAGAVLTASFPPYRLPFLLPAGFALLLTAVDGLRPKQGFYLGFACGAVYFGATLFWLANLFGAASISLIAIAASFPALFGAAYAFLRKKLPGLPVWILAPALWTGIEYFRSEPFPLNFGWMGFGYGVVNAPVLAMIASWAGCYGVTFVVCQFGALLRGHWWPAPALLWVVMLMIQWSPPQPANPVHVRMVQAMSDDEEDLLRFSRAAGPRPDVLVWPEYSFLSDPTKDAKLWGRITDVAKRGRSVLVFGAKEELRGGQDAFRNTAYVIGPDGSLLGKHYKIHPVHFIKDGLAGTDASAIPSRVGRLGVAVCFDMDFPEVARRLAQDGAEVFLVPNMDPAEWGDLQRDQHRLMFQMRAEECGKWLARADVAGGTCVAAPNGQEVARIRSGEPGYLDAIVGRNSDRTLYVRGGWIFGPACLAASVLLLLAGLLRRRDPAMEE